ncbi:hypothetical protein E2C01_051377 [Portunus trituberculatus]|uniref:Uncharacterized protein n=1 Tax=Portunus trituberculatus TaxID=210409 RepID=A0A5B7GK57_PORTR|nr:hypothetical protein [Portunus trituberculatus]
MKMNEQLRERIRLDIAGWVEGGERVGDNERGEEGARYTTNYALHNLMGRSGKGACQGQRGRGADILGCVVWTGNFLIVVTSVGEKISEIFSPPSLIPSLISCSCSSYSSPRIQA